MALEQNDQRAINLKAVYSLDNIPPDSSTESDSVVFKVANDGTGTPGLYVVVADTWVRLATIDEVGGGGGSSPVTPLFADGLYAIGGDTLENNVFLGTIPANTMPTAAVRFQIAGHIENNTGGNVTFTWRLSLGSTVLWGDVVTVATGAFGAGIWFQGLIFDDGAGNQMFNGQMVVGSTTAGASVAGSGDINSDEIEGHAAPGGTATEDPTSALDLKFTVQMNNASAATYVDIGICEAWAFPA